MVPPGGSACGCGCAGGSAAAGGLACRAWISDASSSGEVSAAVTTIHTLLRATLPSVRWLKSGARMPGGCVQQLDDFLVALGARDRQRGVAALALRLHVGAGAHQQLDHVGAAVGCG